METSRQRRPWLWVPSLYFSEGIPYVIVMTMSVIMYKRLGISNTDIALYTSWLYLPWVIKPLWSPVVDITRTKRFWVVTMQFLIAGGLAAVALTLPAGGFFKWSLALFWVMAFASATHDIAADGFYMLGLTPHQQAWWVGLRSTFYRAAMIVGSGLLVVLAGQLETKWRNIPMAWSATLLSVAGLFLLFSLWHSWVLPRPAADGPVVTGRKVGAEFFATFGSFFEKPGVVMALAFILLYRFDEAQLAKVISPFLLDSRAAGGLGLSTSRVGLAYGTCGVAALTCGGLLGGFTAARYGLKRMLPIMVCSMYLPKLAFVFLSFRQPDSFLTVCASVAVEQFGYGFGFTAFMLYLLLFADGPHKTAHYAICTGFMALGMMIPGMWSGWLAERLGYKHFFLWVICSTLPGLMIALRLKVDPQFGRK
ncbi:MAG: MFS transporter [Verrucomicrobiota bacterium]|jgi:PAT family beta-lactamase induction signal transducer AmpG